MKLLRRRQFGNPILRKVARILSAEEIVSSEIQQLIKDMSYTLEKRKYGVGLAAPQVGREVALSVIGIKPTPTRPNLKKQDLIIINPEIIELKGKKEAMWEGCISGPELYAQVPRHTKLRMKWVDEKAQTHEQYFEGFIAQVLQHEIDHLNGVLFVDKVEDTTSYMTFSEYKKYRNNHNTKPAAAG